MGEGKLQKCSGGKIPSVYGRENSIAVINWSGIREIRKTPKFDMGHTRENSKSVREGKLQSIVWINTVTYAGGKTQLRIQKKLDRFGGKS